MNRQELTSPLFHPCAWNYGQAEALFRRLFGPPAWEAYCRHGGTATSLRLCEQIAQLDPTFTVPSWHHYHLEPHGGQLLLEAGLIDRAFIFRSSSPEGDWRSGEIGVHPTYVHVPGTTVLNIAPSATLHWVKQDYAFGVGLTLDIAWSDHHRTAIVRAASGRVLPAEQLDEFAPPRMTRENDHLGRYFCTHAAEDKAGLRAAWLLEDGRGVNQPSGEMGLTEPANFYPVVIAQRLRDGLLELGVNFGVRVELIIDPERPEIVNLVHLRPTPTCVREKLLAL